MLLLLSVLISAADVTQAAPPPPAPPPPIRFGAVSDLVWTSGTSLHFNASSPMVATRPANLPSPMAQGDDFSGEADIAVAIDYFFAKQISIGGVARANYAWSPTLYGPGFGVGPRIGYVMSFSDWVAFWPRLDLTFGAQGAFARMNAPEGTASGLSWFFNTQINLPLVFTFFSHVLVGIGPYFSFQPQWVANNGDLSAFALNFGLTTFVGLHY